MEQGAVTLAQSSLLRPDPRPITTTGSSVPPVVFVSCCREVVALLLVTPDFLASDCSRRTTIASLTRFVVLTGPPHSGKTTLIEALRGAGHAVIPEAALEIITELGDRDPPWRAAHPGEFQTLIAQRQAGKESAARDCSSDVVFLDRGLVDGLAYCRLRNEPVSRELAELVAAADYHRVFLLDLILPFDGRSETGRSSDEVVALKIHAALRQTWSQFRPLPIGVPVMPLAERLSFVLDRV